MDKKIILSGYLDYLPSVLSKHVSEQPHLLGQMLCIFEKILTGIQDEEAIEHNGHNHDPLEKTIDELSHLFNPWTVKNKPWNEQQNFLDFLASWVAIDLNEKWTEYHKRKLISEIVNIYQHKGTKKALQAYLDIYAMSNGRPRIAIDDGEAIFRATFLDNNVAKLYAFAYSQRFRDNSFLMYPAAIAVDNNNNYIIADLVEDEKKPILWKISSTGENVSGNENPFYTGNVLHKPVAIAIDNDDNYYVLDSDEKGNPSIYRFNNGIDPYDKSPDIIVDKETPKWKDEEIYPTDMIFHQTEDSLIKYLIVLDLGSSNYFKTSPKIWLIKIHEGRPTEANKFKLKKVKSPTALVKEDQWKFIITDAGEQFNETDNEKNLIRVKFDAEKLDNSPAVCKLLDSKNNPLIFPIALAMENSSSVIVCDTGLKVGLSEGFNWMSEPVALYRVNLSVSVPTIETIKFENKLVNPSKMIFDNKGRLIITDKGEKSIENEDRRANQNEFGVIIAFSHQRKQNIDITTRNRIQKEILNIVEEWKPAHSNYWFKYERST